MEENQEATAGLAASLDASFIRTYLHLAPHDAKPTLPMFSNSSLASPSFRPSFSFLRLNIAASSSSRWIHEMHPMDSGDIPAGGNAAAGTLWSPSRKSNGHPLSDRILPVPKKVGQTKRCDADVLSARGYNHHRP